MRAERDSQFRAPHNLFALMEPLLAWDQVQSHTPPPALFTFLAGGQPFNGTPASKIEINNDTDAEYTWDAASGRWQRSALIDATGQVKPHLAGIGDADRAVQRHRAEDRRRERQGAARR